MNHGQLLLIYGIEIVATLLICFAVVLRPLVHQRRLRIQQASQEERARQTSLLLGTLVGLCQNMDDIIAFHQKIQVVAQLASSEPMPSQAHLRLLERQVAHHQTVLLLGLQHRAALPGLTKEEIDTWIEQLHALQTEIVLDSFLTLLTLAQLQRSQERACDMVAGLSERYQTHQALLMQCLQWADKDAGASLSALVMTSSLLSKVLVMYTKQLGLSN